MSLLDSKTYLEDLHTAVGAAKGLDRLSGATVLITGATGLIGSFVADMLLAANREAGLHVRVLAAGRDPDLSPDKQNIIYAFTSSCDLR